LNWAALYRPGFLWGLLFLGGVLLIHLLKRPRARLLEFSTLRFFRTTAVRSSRMKRLRSILLLLARLLAVLVIVALFAQPYDKGDRLSLLRDPHCTIFTWVDRTMSMKYAAAGGDALIAHAGSLIDSLETSLPATIRHLSYDESRNEFTLRDKAPSPRSGVRYGPSMLNEALRAWNEARGGYSLPVLLLFSDFQKPTTAFLDSQFSQWPHPPEAPIICVDLAPRNPWNYSLRNPVFHEADNLSRISVTVGAQGRRLDSGEVSVILSNITAEHKRASVAAGDSGEVLFDIASVAKIRSGSVSLGAGDPLPFDNTCIFAADARKALRVIIVGDTVKNFPIAAAFHAAGKTRWDPVVAKLPRDVVFDDLDSAGVIVMSDIGSPPRQLEAFLSGRSSVGKVIVYAVNTGDEDFGESATFVAGRARLKKPLTLASPAAPATIVLPDTISETWRGFPALATREAAVYRYAEGLPGVVLLRLDNGVPILTRFADAEGRTWLLAATPLGVTGANNLCETGFYVPALDRVARYAAGSISGAAEVWIAGFKHRNLLLSRGKSATVLNSEGVAVERWQSQPDVVFKQPGVYTVMPDGEEAYSITVIADPEESRLDYRVPRVPGPLKAMVMVINGQQLREAVHGRGRFASDIPWVLLALVLLAEVLLWENSRVQSVKA
jgi:hypothetical protein